MKFEPYKWKVAIRITRRIRSKRGFIVEGPDGQTYIARTKAEALSNLKTRMRCHSVKPWTIKPKP